MEKLIDFLESAFVKVFGPQFVETDPSRFDEFDTPMERKKDDPS